MDTVSSRIITVVRTVVSDFRNVMLHSVRYIVLPEGLSEGLASNPL